MKNSAAPFSHSAAPPSKLSVLAVAGGTAALILAVAGGTAYGFYAHWMGDGRIAPGVHIAGQDVGGLTKAEAAERLDRRFGKVAVTLETGDRATVLGLGQIGARPAVQGAVARAYAVGRSGNALENFGRVYRSEAKGESFPLPLQWNRGALTSQLKIINRQYSKSARDAKLVAVSGGAPRVQSEQIGRALDVSASADAIQKRYYLGLPKLEAVTRTVSPAVTAVSLQGHDVKLGDFTTRYNGGIEGRTTNIHVACRALDGQVLMPGQTLSFNGLTGERTYSKGYRMAHVFMREAGQSESQIVDGLAGGVCQVSSTLYNAVRDTNAADAGTPLQVVERNTHSLPVTYVRPGRDATVAWPNRDFKFRNAQSYPVYVRTQAGKGKLTITIWGRVPDGGARPVSLQN